MIINLKIERLVLDGIALAGGDDSILRAAVKAELGRLLTESALAPRWSAGGAFAALPVGELRLTEGEGAEALGRRIAHTVYGSIGG